MVDVTPEPLIRRLVDSLPAMMAYWDRDQRCRFANRAYEHWFGVSPEALIGKPMTELLGPLYALNLPYVEGALRGDAQRFERTIPDPLGGPPRHSQASYIPDVHDGVVRGFFVLVTDVSELKRAEQELQRSRERLDLALRGANLGAWDWHIPTGAVAFTARWAEMRGYVLGEVAPHVSSWRDGLHPDDVGPVETALKLHFTGVTADYEVEHRARTKDGAYIWILDRGRVVERDAAGLPVRMAGTELDITERRRMQEALRASEAKFAGIVNTSADAIITIDEQRRITTFNPGAEAIFGYAREEVMGGPIDLLLPERSREAHRSHIDAFESGATESSRMNRVGRVVTGRRKNGEEFPADAAISKVHLDGRVIFAAVVRDVTEQQRILLEERFLSETSVLLAASLDDEATLVSVARLAVKQLADVCIIDIVDGRGLPVRRTVAHADPSRADVCAALERARAGGALSTLVEVAQRKREPIIVEDLAVEIGDDPAAVHLRLLRSLDPRSAVCVPIVRRERVLGVLVLIHATRTRRFSSRDLALLEELARRAAVAIENAELFRAAQRATRARDDVLAIVAHDVRNPLSAIGLAAASLERLADKEGGERMRKSVDAITRGVARASRLIEDLLDVTRIEAGQLRLQLTPLSALQIVADVATEQSALVSAASLELRVDAEAEQLPDVHADRERVMQVFSNLVGNAMKFTPPGGRITVGGRRVDGAVSFFVTDTGKGIAPDHAAHAFDRFWQADGGERKGAGLGLSICRGIVDAHGGRIWLDSALGRGTTVYFTIPVPAPAQRATEPPAPPAP